MSILRCGTRTLGWIEGDGRGPGLKARLLTRSRMLKSNVPVAFERRRFARRANTPPFRRYAKEWGTRIGGENLRGCGGGRCALAGGGQRWVWEHELPGATLAGDQDADALEQFDG